MRRSDGRLFALGYDGNRPPLRDTDGDGPRGTRPASSGTNKATKSRESIGNGVGPAVLPRAVKTSTCATRATATGEFFGDHRRRQPPTGGGLELDAIGQLSIRRATSSASTRGTARIASSADGPSGLQPRSASGGTIIRLSPGLETPEIVATGSGFLVSRFAFNAAGDLFCFDQEARWLPERQPLRRTAPHPERPATASSPRQFRPQTRRDRRAGSCPRLRPAAPVEHFNEPVAGGTAIFGLAWWRGDVFAGRRIARKNWRTSLAKTVCRATSRRPTSRASTSS